MALSKCGAHSDGSTVPVIRMVAATTGTRFGRPVIDGHIHQVARGFSHFAVDARGALVGERTDGDLAHPVTSVLGSTQVLTTDASGNVILGGNGMVRVVAARTETRYGVAMTAGRIYTLAGAPGRTPMTGDGAAAAKAGIGQLADLAVHPATGDILLVENDGPLMRLRAIGATTGSVVGQRVAAGTIQTLAGAGMTPPTDGAPIADVELIKGQAVTATADGGLLLLSGDTLVSVDTAGIMTRLAGQGMPRFSPDGSAGDQAWLYAHDLALGSGGAPVLGGQDGVRVLR